MTDRDGSREQGIDFGDVDDALSSTEYPVTAGELVADYGDAEVGTSRGHETLDEVLGEYEANESFESEFEVKQAVLTMVGGDAVGRRGYTDRDPPAGHETTHGDDTGPDSF